MKQQKLSEAEKVLEYIEAMLLALPMGIDEDADENNTSPDDAVAHIGGLMWKKIREYWSRKEMLK